MPDGMIFYLGTHETSWLARTDVPLFLSHRRLRQRRSFPRALGTWALDSGGFTELSMFGDWETSAAAYADAASRYQAEIGGLAWAAPQDWMCEPLMLSRTGLTVNEHQARTLQSVLRLRDLAPHVPWVPVLQGWRIDDYVRHIALYAEAGITLENEPVVGLGSVCRRQGSREIADLVRELAAMGLRLHGFGMKIRAFAGDAPHLLASADSLAWSYDARRSEPLPGCPHRSCANCIRWALAWRERTLAATHGPRQLGMAFGVSAWKETA